MPLPPSARSAVGARRVQRHGRANKSLQCLLVNLLALVEVDGTPDIAIEAGVEEACWVLKCGALGKGHLDDVLVRLAGADQSVVGPHRNPSPLPLLDHLGVGLLDQCAELGEHLAPPVAQLRDPLVYHPRWRLSFLRPALPHDVSFFPFLLFLAAHVRHHRAPTNGDRGSGRRGTAAPARWRPSPRSRRPTYELLLARQLLAGEDGAGGQRAHLLVAHVAWRPAEAAVGIDGELLRLAHGEDALDALRHVLGRLGVEALDVDDARAELAVSAELLPDVELGKLASRELEDELVSARLEDSGEVGAVRAIEARAAEAIAEADVKAELGLDALGGEVEEPGHLLARDIAACRLVDLDELGPGRDQALQLLVDHLGEALGHVHHALVHLAGMNARAEGERARAGRLGRLGRVRLEVLELLDDAEASRGRLDAADGLVARLLVVAPGPGLPAHGQRLDALDDGVVGIDVAVQAPDFAVGDDVEAGALHVADGRVRGIVEHLLEVAR